MIPNYLLLMDAPIIASFRFLLRDFHILIIIRT